MKNIFCFKNCLLTFCWLIMASNIQAQTIYPNSVGAPLGPNAGIVTGAGTFIGVRAGLENTGADALNTYVGQDAGRRRTGSFNSFSGHYSGFGGLTLTGSQNSFFGAYTGNGFIGSSNTFVGESAGWFSYTAANTGGDFNVFVGDGAGENFFNGGRNTFLGSTARSTVTSATVAIDNSVAVGFNSIVNSNTSVAIGNSSTVHTGSINAIAIGPNSRVLANSPSSIAIGNFAWVDPNFNNATAIGDQSYANCSNCMTLGNGYNNVNFKVGIGTSNPLGNFVVADMVPGTAGSNDIRFLDLPADNTLTTVLAWNGTTGSVYTKNNLLSASCSTTGYIPFWSGGQLACSIIRQGAPNNCTGTPTNAVAINGAPLACATPAGGTPTNMVFAVYGNSFASGGNWTVSDAKLKKEINPIASPIAKIKQLNGVSYKYRTEEFKEYNLGATKSIGFIAQDVKNILPEAVMELDNGTLVMNYSMIIPVITEAIKEQQAELDQKDADIKEMKEKISSMEAALASCYTNHETSQRISNDQTEVAALDQNNPNPFSESTSIRYYIPSTSKNSILKIYSINGEEIKSVKLNGTGKGQVVFNGGELSSGTYVYNLIIDGKQVDSKWMTLTK